MHRGLKKTAGGVGVGSRVAILGTGGLGMQGVKIAKLLGAHVTCTDRVDTKLERARGLGADCVINTDRDELVATARELVGPFDVVVDTIGMGRSLLDAVTACRNGGRVVALGYVDPTLAIPSYEVTIKEKQVVGSRAAQPGRDVFRRRWSG